ncbi:helix-turn-helix domain-containing protein [Paenibacillus senegalensis]|uniref:helix-turn-helix domain-containing protein n=1 Tax=Paenibacillus senegalensis TaxID=1465766 RepID=UPI000288E793|nr:helix-turn-helix domain-containing protein [Paenibacillus senegalensis]
MKPILTKLGRMTYKRKLLAYSLLISIVPVILIGWGSSYLMSKSIQEEVDQTQQLILRQIQNQLNIFIRDLNISSISLASNTTLERAVELPPTSEHVNTAMELSETIRRQKSFSAIRYEVSLLSLTNGILYSDRSHASASYFKQMIENEQPKFNSSIMITPNTYINQDQLLIFRPVPLHTYYSDGVVILHISIRELMKFVERLELDPSYRLYVVDGAGKIMISHNENDIGSTLTSGTELYEMWKSPATSHEYRLNEEVYQVTTVRSTPNDWTYITLFPMKELNAKSHAIQRFTWMMVLALSLIWAIVVVLGSRKLYGPIEHLLNKLVKEDKWDKHYNNELQALDSFMLHMIDTNKELKDQLTMHIPDLQQSMFQKLIRGEWDQQQMYDKITQLNLPLHGASFYVCLAAVDDFKQLNQLYPTKDLPLIYYALKNMTEEVFNKYKAVVFSPQHGQLVILISAEKELDHEVKSKADLLRLKVSETLPFTVSAALSRLRFGYASIAKSYQEALSLLNYRLLLGNNITISDRHIEPSVRQSSRDVFRWKKKIVQEVIQGEQEAAEHSLQELVQIIPLYAQNSETVLGLFSHLLGELEYHLGEMDLSVQSFFEESLYDSLHRLETLPEIKGWLSEQVFPTIIHRLNEGLESKQKQLVGQVLFYIHQGYDSDITLQQIADKLDMSPSQISRLFKEETKLTFSEYVIQFRMKKACEWLLNTDMSIKEVADRLRYTNVQNFTRTFKQIKGVPPGEYRKQTRSG